jgi:hypothetical protein
MPRSSPRTPNRISGRTRDSSPSLRLVKDQPISDERNALAQKAIIACFAVFGGALLFMVLVVVILSLTHTI